ncbi:MAG: hypothetical protein ACREDL_00775, partial [Bradyrhizobium sp.]
LEALSGNERLIEAATRALALKTACAEWLAGRQTIAARLPAYRTTLRLVELGARGPKAAMQDICDRRRLLDEPDPVPPLRQDAAAELRSALNAAFEAHQAAFAKAEAALKDDANWQALSPDDRHAIRARDGLLPVPRPGVATPDDIVTALTARSLSGWADLTRGLPEGVRAAVDEAAERLQPDVQPVTLPAPGTVSDLTALDAWLARVRDRLVAALAKGPVRPRF